MTPTSRRGSCALRPLPGASCAAMPPTRAPTRRGSPGCASAAGGPVLGLEVRHCREQRVLSGLVDGPRQDARRESRPPRNSPLSPEPSTAPRTEFQPLPSALLPAGGGRSPSGTGWAVAVTGLRLGPLGGQRCRAGSRVFPVTHLSPPPLPKTLRSLQPRRVLSAGVKTLRGQVCSWSAVARACVRVCACAHPWTRVHSSVCVLACMRVRVHVCARAALRLQAAGRPSLSPRQQARPRGAREAAGPRRGRAWRELPRRLRRPHGAAPSPQGRRTAATSPRWRPRCGRRTTRS